MQLCFGYFSLSVIIGIMIKWFLAHGMHSISFLVYSSAGASLLIVPVVIALRWYRLESNRRITWMGMDLPSELLYIIPSGICCAVILPATTLMFTLPITVMTAMTIMRGSVIVIGRVVDEIQIRQGILKKKVHWAANVAVLFALCAIGVHLYVGWLDGQSTTNVVGREGSSDGAFDFVRNPAALTICLSYIFAYGVRIYLMNYFKNTRGKTVKLDNKGFFAIEQFTVAVTLVLVTAVLVTLPLDNHQISLVRVAITTPLPYWSGAVLAGMTVGISVFFSVGLFMFKGRTATFSVLVNRLTSLVGGTTATLIFWLCFSGRAVETADWIALLFVCGAIALLTIAEQQEAIELRAAEQSQSEAAIPSTRARQLRHVEARSSEAVDSS
ncbi:MAG: hypothetical protein JXA30_00100 [Deltaproteobacteria bacterium]|nr:hypothetical protein [Deltaproteobacteria bacterium]